MEEEGDKTKLIVGAVAAVIVLIAGFFLVRGFLSKKPQKVAQLPSTTVATPTPYQKANNSVSPTPQPVKTGSETAGSSGTPVYYYQSGSTNSQTSQSQSGSNQSQTQTLPNGMTQSQSQ